MQDQDGRGELVHEHSSAFSRQGIQLDIHLSNAFEFQILINNKLSEAKSLWDLDDYDRDLTMFTITNLTLSREEDRNVVNMALKLKRKVSTELLTTYFPTILLLLITFTTTFFLTKTFSAMSLP